MKAVMRPAGVSSVCTIAVSALFLLACGSSEGTGSPAGTDAVVIGDTSGSGDAAGFDAGDDTSIPGEDVVVRPDVSTGPAACVTSADCRGGEICREELCREVCAADNPCDGVLGICDETSGICVECVEADDCSAGEACSDGLCEDLVGQPCTDSENGCARNSVVLCVEGELTVEGCGAQEVCVDGDTPACVPLVCTPSGLDCVNGQVEVCSADGTSAELIDCDAGTSCVEGVCEESACEPDSTTCVGNRLSVCDDEGNQTLSDCAECEESAFGCTCRTDACVARVCEPGSNRCAATGVQTCNADGLGFSAISPCEEGASCRSGVCRSDSCETGDTICVENDVLACNETGNDFELSESCGSDARCVDGACVEQVCTPLTRTCSGSVLSVCSSDGLSETLTNCDSTDRYCDPIFRMCQERICSPAEAPMCDGTQLLRCQANGSAYEVAVDCGETGCTDGACNNPCEGRTDLLGCEFWTADFEQIRVSCSTEDPCSDGGSCSGGFCSNEPRALSVGFYVYNPGDTTVQVTVRNNRTNSNTAPVSVGARSSGRLYLPAASDLVGTSLSSQSFVITSTGPIAAWHEGPRADVTPITSIDLTRILPTHALGLSYVVAGFGANIAIGNDAFRPMMTVIATQDGTSLSSQPTTAIAAGTGVASILANAIRTTPMSRGQILALVPSADPGDLSGSRHISARPLAVFSSYGCAGVPLGTGYCDHLVEQVPPASIAAGREFVIARSAARGTEDDIVRVTVPQNGPSTTVNYSALRSGGSAGTTTLGAGESVTLKARQSIRVTATSDVVVHQYLVGAEYSLDGDVCEVDIFSFRTGCAIPDSCSGSGVGDPSMAILIPTTHWSDSHLLHAPAGFPSRYASVSMPAGTTLRLNGEIEDLARISIPGGFERMVLNLSADVNTLTASNPVGVLVHGYACGGSFAYGGEFR